MEEEFLRKYYVVGKTTSVQKAIREFTQGTSETFHEAWEQLRDLTRECPHHGVSNHELTQIFYDALGPQDRYLFECQHLHEQVQRRHDGTHRDGGGK